MNFVVLIIIVAMIKIPLKSTSQINNIQSELLEGMKLAKCKKCGCMKDALESLSINLIKIKNENTAELLNNIKDWQEQIKPIKYSCLGCKYCFPAVALNLFNQSYPDIEISEQLSCGFEVKEQWPVVPGEYFSFCDGDGCSVAVSTLASVALAEQLAKNRIKELCIVGKTETENIGIDKLIKNTITNKTIKYLILSGKDSEGHQSGKTILEIWKNGVNDKMRVIGSQGKRPILNNVNIEEIEAFRKQIEIIDLIGCEDVEEINQKIQEIASKPISNCSCNHCNPSENKITFENPEIIQANIKESKNIILDKAGYFYIIPIAENNKIRVEHYSYDNKLLRIIEGNDARNLYWTIIENNWVTLLSHASYLGKELEKAELSLKYGFKYIQDGA